MAFSYAMFSLIFCVCQKLVPEMCVYKSALLIRVYIFFKLGDKHIVVYTKTISVLVSTAVETCHRFFTCIWYSFNHKTVPGLILTIKMTS